ncbi:MAG: outer membrane lipoprotein-sorting protein [Alphaproteobacteria bacterium]|nr:outer membrane lipoprotein-sorting protein [Alphaproteobacteria bacterium]
MKHLFPSSLNKILIAGFIFLVLMQSNLVIAKTPEEKGFEIASRSDRSDRGFNNSESTATMVLRNKQGKESKRILFQRTLEIPDETLGDKSIIVFKSPADVNGTAMLSHSKILEADDQWLYLPALKRIKRISSKNKSGPFLGSEFSFEDFTAQELGKFEYKYIRSEECGNNLNLICDVVERTPQYEFSGYTKQIAWIDQRDYQARKIDFYDRKNELLKTLIFNGYKKYTTKINNHVWRAHNLNMVNHLTGKSSDFIFSNYKFEQGLTDKDFVKGVLTHVR